MGIMDKIFGGKKKNQESTQEELNKQFNELEEKLEKSLAENENKQFNTVDSIYDVHTRLEQFKKAPVSQEISSITQEEAKKVELEMVKKEFLETHATVEKFRQEFLADQMRKKLGIQPSSESVKKLETLRTSKLVNDRYFDKIFLPYLVEKKALGIISNKEEQELTEILGKNSKIEDFKNLTTSYTSDFENALIILGTIGIIDVEDFNKGKIFPKGNETRNVFLSKGNMGLYSEVYYLSNNKKPIKPIDYCPFPLDTPECKKWMQEYVLTEREDGTKPMDDCSFQPYDIERCNDWIENYIMNHIIEVVEPKNITPTQAVKNALKDTSKAQSSKARDVEVTKNKDENVKID